MLAMQDDDPAILDTEASASGILQCLRMLAEEAADLRLQGTLRALHEAIAICQTERLPAAGGTAAVDVILPAGTRLH